MKKLLITTALILSTLSISIAERDNNGNGWKTYNGHRYFRYPHKLTWYEAVCWAERFKSQILIIDDQHELEWINNNFTRTELVWLGFDEFNGSWFPLDGTPLNYTKFDSEDGTPVFNSGVVMNVKNNRGQNRGSYSVRSKSERYVVIFEKE